MPDLTIFTAPKPFTNPHINIIQRNAIQSWVEMGSRVEVIVIGREEGLVEAAADLGADSSEEMFDWARALAWCPPPKGRGVAVLTNAGGPGVTAADALETHGLYLADLTNDTCLALREILPPAASLHSPVGKLNTQPAPL